MPTLEEISKVMNPIPAVTMGGTGDGQLDFWLAAGEERYRAAQQQCNQLKPIVKQEPENGIQQCGSILARQQAAARQFFASAESYLADRKTRAQKHFASATPKAEATPEQIDMRVRSLQTLFDALNQNKIIAKIEKELWEGDTLTKYVLRDYELWVRYYLESRKIDLADWYLVIQKTAGILESDLQAACQELLVLPQLFQGLEDTQGAVERSFTALGVEVISWPKPKMAANSLEDLPDSHVITAGDLKKYGSAGAFALSRR
jgi:hypothetical protein